MPAGAVQNDHAEGARRDRPADLGQMQVHSLRIGLGQNQANTGFASWAHGPKYVGPVIPLVA